MQRKLTQKQLGNEPPLKFSHLYAFDGNNSLKRMLTLGECCAADTRVLTDSDYFLLREFVDRFSNEVKARRRPGSKTDRR